MEPVNDWDDQKLLAQDIFDDEAQSYQDMVMRGDFLPNRNMDMEIAEEAYNSRDFPLFNPEQDVSNTEIDDYYDKL